RRKDRLDVLLNALHEEYHADVLALALDVQDRKQVETLIQNLPSSWKSIDILLNNAGLALTTDLMQEADPQNWDIMIRVNLCGLLYVTHAILPTMISRNAGHIINISST